MKNHKCIFSFVLYADYCIVYPIQIYVLYVFQCEILH